ncbi:MAG: hypothetical protein CMI01_01170 [Oceanospirillaceae bacterium]|nr:hypothetical protein [Oceanospirillaceae bacterium]
MKRILIIIAASITVFLVYKNGTSGTLYYDDYANLTGLEDIQTGRDALIFALSGDSGPLGRPVALATFALQHESWPNGSESLLLINILIHIFNAFLLGFLGFLLLKSNKKNHTGRIFQISFLSAFFWVCSPLLVSTNLIAVQRMTSLAATFSLLGLVFFFYLIGKSDKKPFVSYLGAMFFLGVGTLLGLYTKENAALTPVFAFWLYIFFSEENNKKRRFAVLIPLGVALVFIAYYISPLKQDWFSENPLRGWSAWNRFQTEWVILWDYLRLTFAPVPSQFSPFHDGQPLIHDNLKSYAAGMAWVVALTVALWLSWVRHSRLMLFALLWFWTGHLLESTTINLELRFEHRNYLALWGIWFALCYGALSFATRYKPVVHTVIAGYAVVQVICLWLTTTLWGQPSLALAIWSENNPGSGRALSHAMVQDPRIAGIIVSEAGERRIDPQRGKAALNRMDTTLRACPECMGVHLKALEVSCALEPKYKVKERLEAAISATEANLGRSTEVRATYDQLFVIRENIISDRCKYLSYADLYKLIQEIAENRFFQHPEPQARLQFLAAAISEDAGLAERRDRILSEAAKNYPAMIPILEYQVYSAIRDNRYDDAYAVIDNRIKRFGDKIPKRYETVLDALRKEITDARLKHENNPGNKQVAE